MSDTAREYLRDLVEALDGAFISTWQSTAAWQKQLDAAREFLNSGQPPREDRDLHSHMMIVATRASVSAGDVSHKAMLRNICRAIAADKNLMRKLADQVGSAS